MVYRCAVLDDYQKVARRLADWSVLGDAVERTVFDTPLGDAEAVAQALAPFDIVCLMRERTRFPREVIEALPRLRLLVTTGMRNAAIDMAAAADRGIVVSGTQMGGPATAELVFAHLLEFARHAGAANLALKSGTPWQTSVGIELAGKTLGIVGLGNLGQQVARIGTAFGMQVIAWSQNLTPEKCVGTGAAFVSREELFSTADFISIHLLLSARTRGLIGAADLSRMKPTAFLVNTSRGPIVEEAALIEAMRDERIAGAGLDHPFRTLPRAQITPHLGYVTEEVLRVGYGQTVEDIAAFVAGTPIRVVG